MPRKIAVLVLFLLAHTTAYFVAGFSKLYFDYDFEKFFPQDDPETQYFNEYRKTFDSDNDFVLVALLNEKGIFQEEFLNKVATLTDSLKNARYVTLVSSPTNIKQLTFDPIFGAPLEKPWLRYKNPDTYNTDSLRIYRQPELNGTFFSPKGKAICILLKTENYIGKTQCDELSADLDRILAQFTFDEVHVAGRSTGQAYYVKLLEREFIIFVSISMVLIVLFLIIAFRSAWGVWVPLLVVMMAVVWTVGVLARLDKPLGIMLNILPVIIFVVGVSDVVHLITRYFEELRQQKPKMLALKVAFKEVGMATFLTSLTTGIGFLTLLTANIRPIVEFGTYTAIGVLLAFVLAFTLLPAVLILAPVPKAVNHPANLVFWNRHLRNYFRFTLANRTAILVAGGAVLAVSLIGVSMVRSDNFLLEDLRESDPLKQQFYFLEEHFGGVRPFEMAVDVVDPHKTVWNLKVLEELEEVSDYLEKDYGVGSQMSVVNIIKSLNQAQHNGNITYYRLPDNEDELQFLQTKLERVQKTGVLKAFVTEDGKKVRFSGRIADSGNVAVTALNHQLDSFMVARIDPELLQYKITGTSQLIDLNNSYLSKSMIYGLLIAFGVIALIMGILFRSTRIIIIALIPNILPLLMIGALMGFANIPLKVSTSIIFTIAFGIAVDDTIHFMSKLKLELAKGKSMLYALKRTYLSTGKAIIVTSIILCGGFITLIFSGFLGTFYIGVLISLTLLFAVVADLTILPVMLIFFYGNRRNKGN
jgi:uncharacterized protein